MKCMVIGARSRKVERRNVELSHAEALALSDEAIVVSLESMFGGSLNAYYKGESTQLVYDGSRDAYVGQHAAFDEDLGWLS